MGAWWAPAVRVLVLQAAWALGGGQVRYSVPEEAKAGTVVGRLAQDLGLEAGEAEARRLRLVAQGRRASVEVSGASGALVVSSRLDREELCGKSAPCALRLEVLVERPLRVFHVELEVTDINDNAPLFPVNEEALNIAESSMPGSRFPLEGASDADVGANAQLSYALSPNEHFSLEHQGNKDQGASLALVLTKPLDRESVAVHRLVLTASDGGRPPLTGTVELVISVLDANDNAPQFNQSVYKVEVLEGSEPGSVLLTLSATDLDEGFNSNIMYLFGRHVTTKVKEMLTIDENRGEIRLRGKLDYEEIDSYEITVEARDKGSPPAVGSLQRGAGGAGRERQRAGGVGDVAVGAGAGGRGGGDGGGAAERVGPGLGGERSRAVRGVAGVAVRAGGDVRGLVLAGAAGGAGPGAGVGVRGGGAGGGRRGAAAARQPRGARAGVGRERQRAGVRAGRVHGAGAGEQRGGRGAGAAVGAGPGRGGQRARELLGGGGRRRRGVGRGVAVGVELRVGGRGERSAVGAAAAGLRGAAGAAVRGAGGGRGGAAAVRQRDGAALRGGRERQRAGAAASCRRRAGPRGRGRGGVGAGLGGAVGVGGVGGAGGAGGGEDPRGGRGLGLQRVAALRAVGAAGEGPVPRGAVQRRGEHGAGAGGGGRPAAAAGHRGAGPRGAGALGHGHAERVAGGGRRGGSGGRGLVVFGAGAACGGGRGGRRVGVGGDERVAGGGHLRGVEPVPAGRGAVRGVAVGAAGGRAVGSRAGDAGVRQRGGELVVLAAPEPEPVRDGRRGQERPDGFQPQLPAAARPRIRKRLCREGAVCLPICFWHAKTPQS
ncbi:spidroin-1-like isoform X9 [Falco naumanni]|uniref:spidroin-1-like isoform X9 n=1 Tax=Falco naumanni TaxID=148594 RepID=UPI001ADEB03B|nr:spidroin-1-like isoform X9 [Falco naumanni]XP_040459354.1 spidroin-1-like isoform X9 [Falco naumanni]